MLQIQKMAHQDGAYDSCILMELTHQQKHAIIHDIMCIRPVHGRIIVYIYC